MTDPDLRCAVQTLERGIDPIGTATTADAFVLVELPLPWPSAIEEHPLHGAVADAVASSGWRARVLGTVPDHDDLDRHRVVVHRRGRGPFRRFSRSEKVVATAGLGATVSELLDAELHPDDASVDPVRDLLICTHGRRDRCCGSFGTNLFTAVGASHVRSGVRSARVSHTGGHRFAPTAIILPEGHYWAWLDTELVDRVLHRRGDLDTVLAHYRGSSAMGPAPVQVAEREAFRTEGWSWLDCRRRGSVVDEDGDRVEVRLELTRPDGSTGGYEATVVRIGTTPQPVCGELLMGDGNGKSDSIWSLTRFDTVDR